MGFMRNLGFRGYDPFEDTESGSIALVYYHGASFRGYDPFEDTESCKDETKGGMSVWVSGATIRLRILKVARDTEDTGGSTRFRGYDPFEDTERPSL